MPWVIDKDMSPYPGAAPGTLENATGLVGPESYRGDGSEFVHEFRLVGGDSEVCYEGRSQARDRAPLVEFGFPNAGCVAIRYREGGVWRDL